MSAPGMAFSDTGAGGIYGPPDEIDAIAKQLGGGWDFWNNIVSRTRDRKCAQSHFQYGISCADALASNKTLNITLAAKTYSIPVSRLVFKVHEA